MMKYLILAFSLFVIAMSCVGHTSVIEPVVVVKELKGFDSSQRERFFRIVMNLSSVLESDDFHSAVKGWYFPAVKGFHFHDTTDKNEDVLHKILSRQWLLEYRLEYMRPSTVGYTTPQVTWIAINKFRFNKMSDSEVAANICHEMGGHKVGGYDHSKYYDKKRPYSVPYGIGFLCKTIYDKKFPRKVKVLRVSGIYRAVGTIFRKTTFMEEYYSSLFKPSPISAFSKAILAHHSVIVRMATTT